MKLWLLARSGPGSEVWHVVQKLDVVPGSSDRKWTPVCSSAVWRSPSTDVCNVDRVDSGRVCRSCLERADRHVAWLEGHRRRLHTVGGDG